MKTRYSLAVLMLLFCLSFFGQQPKIVSIQGQPQKTSTQVSTNQQESIKQLQAENEAMKAQLDRMEQEIELYREDVRAKEVAINDNHGHWLTLLSIIIGAIVSILGIGLGVVSPILLNIRNNKKQKEIIESVRTELKTQIESATNDAKSAKESLSAVSELKQDIDLIKKDIDKSKRNAERAARRAMASKLFAQAIAEKDLHKAIELYTKAIELNSYFAEAYSNRGYAKFLLGEEENALQDYDKAIELNPNLSEAYNNRGNAKESLGDENGALEDFDKAIELNPDYANAYNNRGIVKRELGDTTGAMIDFNKAIELKRDFPEAYCNRGVLKEKIGDNTGALLDYDIAIDLNPLFYGSYKCRGILERKVENLIQATRDFSRAIALKATDDELYIERAKCYRQLAMKERESLKKDRFLAKAEADEKKAESLKKGDKL